MDAVFIIDKSCALLRNAKNGFRSTSQTTSAGYQDAGFPIA